MSYVESGSIELAGRWRVVSRSALLCSAWILLTLLGCERSRPTLPTPEPGQYLSRKLDGYSDPHGLVTADSEREAQEHYVAIRARPPNPMGWDLSTFDEWKRRFEFPAREAGETLADYRRRTLQVVYYNRIELALGRELGCSIFTDENGEQGVACFVTNYGIGFGDGQEALDDAVAARRVRNTVCLTYSPALEADAIARGWGAGFGVQFYVYGDDGTLRRSAQLDRMGLRPVPQICTNCHGGIYRPDKNLTQHARFLPANPFSLVFGRPPYDLDSQQEALRFINNLALRVPATLTDAQRTFLRTIYELTPAEMEIPPGRIPTLESDFPGWVTPAQQNLYKQVLMPYCATCHNAFPPGTNHVADWSTFRGQGGSTWSAVIKRDICELGAMPNAQPTMETFWADPVTIGARTWRSPKDLLLQTMAADGLDNGPGGASTACTVGVGQGCTVPGDLAASHGLCGDPTQSGRYCDTAAAGGIGVCRDGCGPSHGNVGCPNYDSNVKECRDGRCVPCGRLGQGPCAPGRCNEGRLVSTGLCTASE